MVTPMIRKRQIFVAAAVVIAVVLVAAGVLIAPENDLSPTSDAKPSDIMSRPSDVTPGNGQDFKPKW